MPNVRRPLLHLVTRRLAAIIGLLLLLFLNSVSHALIRGPNPPSCQSHTLEALAIDADIIMTATMASNYADTRTREWHASFIPSEVLKTRAAYAPPVKLDASLSFFHTSYQYSDGDEKRFRYPAAGARVLLFLRQDNYLLDCICLDSNGPACSLLSARVVDMTLKQVAEGEQVLGIVRTELLRTPATPATRMLFVYPYMLNNLPADERLAPAARQWIHSSDPFARLLGVRVLEATADPHDMPALKSLLGDTAETDYPLLSPWSGRGYLVRAAAWQALRRQGIVVSPPVMQSPRPGVYRPFPWIRLLTFLLGPWLLYVLSRRIGHRPPISFRRFAANGLTFCCFVYTAACVPLWLRSYRTADEIVWASGGLVLAIDSLQGNLFVTVANSWPASTNLVHAAITPDSHEASPIRRMDCFWTGAGVWHIDSSLWTTYIWGWPPFARVVGADTTMISFPFIWRDSSLHPPSKAIFGGAAYLYLIVFFLAFPLFRLLLWTGHHTYRALQAASSARRGLCPACSYDLRAHKAGDRCPECGSVIAALSATQ